MFYQKSNNMKTKLINFCPYCGNKIHSYSLPFAICVHCLAEMDAYTGLKLKSVHYDANDYPDDFYPLLYDL